MATVQVDLSEYDMLRKAKDDAENRVTELLKEVEEYKKNARVIVTTKYAAIGFDKERVVRTIIDAYYKSHSLSRAVEEGITAGMMKIGWDASPNYILESSSQIVGFEDVRAKVEDLLNAEYREELSNKLSKYEHLKKKYEEKYNSLDREYLENHNKEIESIKEEYNNTISSLTESHNKKIAELDSVIESLNSTISELSKSKEEKVAELTAAIQENQAKLEHILGKKKNIFNRIFGYD